VLVVALLLVAAGCGGDDGTDADLPLVGEIAPAMAAVDEALGGPQEYFEVSATPQFVNLFVAGGDGTVTPYVYLDGELEDPAPTQSGAEGATFRADAVTFDPDQVFDTLTDELDDSTVTQFVVLGAPDGAVRYEATVLSGRGGTLSAVLGPEGEILSVDPL